MGADLAVLRIAQFVLQRFGEGLNAGLRKVVLAYSGGLDTSIILKWLQTEYGCEVVTFTADLGQGEELEPARKKAEMLGIPEKIYIEDVREEFVRDFVFPMFRANALYEGVYLLGTSIARPLISKRLVEIAAETGADAVATAPPARATTRCASNCRPMRSTRHQGHRALARLGPQEPHRPDLNFAEAAPDPDRQGQARRSAVLGRREPAALLLRGQGAGRPGPRRRPNTSIAHGLPRTRPTRPRSSNRLREGRRGLDQRRGDEPGDAC
jgi:hypothetical protein